MSALTKPYLSTLEQALRGALRRPTGRVLTSPELMALFDALSAEEEPINGRNNAHLRSIVEKHLTRDIERFLLTKPISNSQIISTLHGLIAIGQAEIYFSDTFTRSMIGTLITEFEDRVYGFDLSDIVLLRATARSHRITIKNPEEMLAKTRVRTKELLRKHDPRKHRPLKEWLGLDN